MKKFKSKLNIFDLVEEVETLKERIKERDLLIQNLEEDIEDFKEATRRFFEVIEINNK